MSFARASLILAVLGGGLFAGCAAAPPPPVPEGQSYKEAIDIICHVDELAGIDPAGDPLSLGSARTSYVNEHVENPEGIYFRTLISVKGAKDQAEAIREEASGQGLTKCPLAEQLAQADIGGLSP